ncbi:MAG: heparinase II/III family protein, partial [Pseudomonadota bacterium]
MANRDLLRDAAEAGFTSAVSKTLGKTYSLFLSNKGYKDYEGGEPELRPHAFAEPDAALLARFLEGHWPLAGGRVSISEGSPWDVEPPNRLWAEELHGFGWLRHFSLRDDEECLRHVRWLVTTWVRAYHTYQASVWEPHLIGRRLTAWLTFWPLIAGEADEEWRRTVLAVMAKQTGHLGRTLQTAPAGFARLEAAAGLTHAALCLMDDKDLAGKGLDLLDTELKKQILPDGVHVSRSPEALLATLILTLAVLDVAEAAGYRVPVGIQNAADRMEAMRDFFRHGDGALALFNGSSEGPETGGDPRLAHNPGQEGLIAFARHSGYHRIQSDRTLLLVDAGGPPPPKYGAEAHAGCLSFELSFGATRLVSNCGVIRFAGEAWRAATRQTAAHSTVTINDRSSGETKNRGLPGILLGGEPLDGPVAVKSERHESDEGVLLELSHDGYGERFNLRHERRIFLNSAGNDLRGEDRIS